MLKKVVYGFLLCAVIITLIPAVETKPYLIKASEELPDRIPSDIEENNWELPDIRIIRSIFEPYNCPTGYKYVQGKCRKEEINDVAYYYYE